MSSTIILYCLLLLFIASVIHVLALRFMPVKTPLMRLRCKQQIKRGERPRLYHKWIPLKDIPEDFKIAVWVGEDRSFISHFGINLKKLANRSFLFFKQKESFTKSFSGTSTISQQTAKNVFLWLDKSILRKFLEVYYTLLIELFWGKLRILEVYLNAIEMGDGIYGVHAAAQHHYHCKPKELTREQIVSIVSCFPNPLRYHCTNITEPKIQRLYENNLWSMQGLSFPRTEEFRKVQFQYRKQAILRLLGIKRNA